MSRGRVLLVDDSEIVRETTGAALEAAGFEVKAIASSLSLPLAVTDLDPDVILLDVCMPGLNGDTALRLSRNRDLLSGVPVLLYSGKTREELAQSGRQAGADGIVSKGESLPSLVRTLDRWVSCRKMRRRSPEAAC